MDEQNNNGFVDLEKKSEEQKITPSEAENIQNIQKTAEQSESQPFGNQGYYRGYNGQGYGQGYNNQGYNGQGYNNQGYDPFQNPRGRVPYGQPNLTESDYRHADMQAGYGPNGGYYPQGQGYPNYYPYYYGNDPYAGFNRPSQGLAVGSMVCGIAGLFSFIFGWIFPPLFLLPIAAVILGAVHKGKGQPIGKGMSTAGIVTGIIGTVLPVILICVMAMHLPEMLDFVEKNDPSAYQEFYEQYGKDYPQFFSSAFTFISVFFGR